MSIYRRVTTIFPPPGWLNIIFWWFRQERNRSGFAVLVTYVVHMWPRQRNQTYCVQILILGFCFILKADCLGSPKPLLLWDLGHYSLIHGSVPDHKQYLFSCQRAIWRSLKFTPNLTQACLTDQRVKFPAVYHSGMPENRFLAEGSSSQLQPDTPHMIALVTSFNLHPLPCL